MAGPVALVAEVLGGLDDAGAEELLPQAVDGDAREQRVRRRDEPVCEAEAVLAEIGAGEVPVELVLNKADRLDAVARRRVANLFPGALLISATTGEGLDELRSRIADRFADRFEEVRLLVPYEEGRVLSDLYALGAPIDERTDTDEGVLVRARLSPRDVRRFAPYLVAGVEAESASSA